MSYKFIITNSSLDYRHNYEKLYMEYGGQYKFIKFIFNDKSDRIECEKFIKSNHILNCESFYYTKFNIDVNMLLNGIAKETLLVFVGLSSDRIFEMNDKNRIRNIIVMHEHDNEISDWIEAYGAESYYCDDAYKLHVKGLIDATILSKINSLFDEINLATGYIDQGLDWPRIDFFLKTIPKETSHLIYRHLMRKYPISVKQAQKIRDIIERNEH